jgi:homoserine O-acetyltransferase
VLPEVRLAYTTVGEPTGEPVLVLHGTTGSAASMLTAGFAGELYGAGQPLDASKYYIIIPDSIGHGRSSEASDGCARNSRNTITTTWSRRSTAAQRASEDRHVRLIIGNSMGGMHTWLWGSKYPDYMDALVPMASQPTEMASRNWMMRRLLIETIRTDPEYNNGNYTAQPRILKIANLFYATGTNGGNLALQKAAPTRAQADKLFETRLAAPMTLDANDYVYAWNSSRDYNAAPGLDRIQAALMVVNAADDERNPPETGLMERELKRVKNGRLLLIPASEATSGHGTTGSAKFYAKELRELLETTPKRAM